MAMFGSAKFTSEASRWGVQPGFIFDLNEGRPYGPGKGQPWDLANDDDMKDVKEQLEFEKPLLLVSGAACDANCMLPGASVTAAARSSRSCVPLYRKQHDGGRWFLHEQPETASSWKDPEVQAMQQLEGILTVHGRMCAWHVPDEGGEAKTIYNKTKWLTNARKLAELLERWSSEHSGLGYRVDIRCDGSPGTQAARYPPVMVSWLLDALKDHMKNKGELNSIQSYA